MLMWGVGYGVGPAALWGMGCEMCNVECVMNLWWCVILSECNESKDPGFTC